MTPRHREFARDTAPPERNEQAPLGPSPSYDDVLDVAVESTFPASDPVAVQTCCEDARARDERRNGGQASDKPSAA